jgi:hypothetical protein
MDEITKSLLMKLSEQHPQSAIHLPRQFLDGSMGKSCGFVPNNYNGSTVRVKDK